MSPMSDQDTLDQVTRTSQIVIAALVAGVLFFLGIAVVVDLRPNQPMAVGAGARQCPGRWSSQLD